LVALNSWCMHLICK